MGFLERLKKLEHARTHPTKPTNPPQGAEKVGFVGFVAPYLASVEVFSPPSPRAANDSPPCTDPKNRGIEAQYKNTVTTNPAHVDTTAAQDWAELDKAYQAHHVACPTCMAAGKGYGLLRCGTGAALWAAYDVAEPVHGKVSARGAQPAPAIHTPSADIHPSLLTAATPDEISVMLKRLSAFAGRGVGVDDADRLVDKLLIRDRENERVGCCVECSHLRGNAPGRWQCGDNARITNELAGAWLGAAFVHQQLHHCPNRKVAP
jgi:sulfur relay (sulfurtransferase) complex TusBCD TusD component (DsrE family)